VGGRRRLNVECVGMQKGPVDPNHIIDGLLVS
jgi:hypothetical protein